MDNHSSYYIDPTSGSVPPSSTNLNSIILEKIIDRLDLLNQKLDLVSNNQIYQKKEYDVLHRRIETLNIRLETIFTYNQIINDKLDQIKNNHKDLQKGIEKLENVDKKQSDKKPSNVPKYRPETRHDLTKQSKPKLPPIQSNAPSSDPYYVDRKNAKREEHRHQHSRGPAGPTGQEGPEGGIIRPEIVLDFFVNDQYGNDGNPSINTLDILSLLGNALGAKKEKEITKKLNEEDEIENEEVEDYSYDSDIEVEDLGEINTVSDLIKLGESVPEIKEKIKKELKEKEKTTQKSDCTLDEMKNDLDEELLRYQSQKYVGFRPRRPAPKPPTSSHTDEHIQEENNLRDREYINPRTKKILMKYGNSEEEAINMINEKTTKSYYHEKSKKINEKELTGTIEKGLYKLGNKYFPFDLDVVQKLVKPLKKLDQMVGMTSLKESILNQILYYLQKFESRNMNMLHTVIEGPPGVGKTEVAKILCKVFVAMGAIKNDKIVVARRKDLVGEYVGHTAPKVENIVKEAEGGVLFIDEAYGLGGGDEKRDTFSREAVNTLTELLSLKKGKFICIIAGYPEEMEKHLFSINPGMERRFPYRHRIDTYTPEEMRKIFVKMINDRNWKTDIEVKDEDLRKFFEKNKETFPYYGGDIENLFMHCRNAHSKRVYRIHPKFRRKFSMDDITSGYKNYKSNRRNDDNDDEIKKHIIYSMYS